MDKISLPELITTDKVTLKKHSVDFAEAMFKTVDSERERLGEFLPWVDNTKLSEDTIKYIEWSNESWSKFTLFDYSIFENCSNQFIGCIGVHNIRWVHDCCELGYWLSKNYEGKGNMLSAVIAIEKECFNLRFHRIEIHCNSNNLRSASVAKKLDYILDGTIKENWKVHNIFYDTLIYGKLNHLSK